MENFEEFYSVYTREQQEKKAKKEEEKLCRRLLREVSKVISDVPGVSRLVVIGEVFLEEEKEEEEEEGEEKEEEEKGGKKKEGDGEKDGEEGGEKEKEDKGKEKEDENEQEKEGEEQREGRRKIAPRGDESISYARFFEVCRELLRGSTTRKYRRLIMTYQVFQFFFFDSKKIRFFCVFCLIS